MISIAVLVPQLIGSSFQKLEISQQLVTRMHYLASEFSKIFRRWYPRTLTAGGGNPLPHPTPSPPLARRGAPRCWDPNLDPPQLFSRCCSPGCFHGIFFYFTSAYISTSPRSDNDVVTGRM